MSANPSSFYLQDSRSFVGSNVMWWAKDGNGYTTDLSKAHHYSIAEAQAQHTMRGTDIPWPSAYVDPRARLVVDMQYLRREEADAVSSGLFYIQGSVHFDGNDVFWRDISGGLTTNLGEAATFTKEEALILQGRSAYCVLWPQAYVDSRSRPAVARQQIQLETALAGTGITLIKPKKPKNTAVRCQGCGRFVNERQIFMGECSHCGADNRP